MVVIKHLAILAIFAWPLQAQVRFGPGGTRFRSEPDIVREEVQIYQMTDNRTLLSPGHLFIAPRTMGLVGWGPKIYDIGGMLIWDGNYTARRLSQTFHACDINGKKGQHLCWHEIGKERPEKHYNIIYDDTYKQWGKDLTGHGNLTTQADQHEFNIVDNGQQYVQTLYQHRQKDLSPWGGPLDGTFADSCFQELDIKFGTAIWTWCYSEHVPEIVTKIYPGSENQTRFFTRIGGNGTNELPWDPFHINSVDKNDEGDYLISGRHSDEIMKVAGPNSPNGKVGHPIWRLGGPANQFELLDGFNFSRQHYARFVSTSRDETIITLFDNTWEGEAKSQSGPCSSAKLAKINNKTMKAELIQQYTHPYGQTSRAGGNADLLPNGNMFVGWGEIRQATEFSHDGQVLYHAYIKCTEPQYLLNYRTYKSPWTGRPHYPPKLIAYAQSCGFRPLFAHVSWNGATNVKYWRFFSRYYPHGRWKQIGVFEKTGFESFVQLSKHFIPYVSAEALDATGRVLSTVFAETFVPTRDALQYCDKEGCNSKPYMYYGVEYNKSCGWKSFGSSKFALAFLVATYELFLWTLSQTIQFSSYTRGTFMPLKEYPGNDKRETNGDETGSAEM